MLYCAMQAEAMHPAFNVESKSPLSRYGAKVGSLQVPMLPAAPAAPAPHQHQHQHQQQHHQQHRLLLSLQRWVENDDVAANRGASTFATDKVRPARVEPAISCSRAPSLLTRRLTVRISRRRCTRSRRWTCAC